MELAKAVNETNNLRENVSRNTEIYTKGGKGSNLLASWFI